MNERKREEPMKNEEGDATVPALREANLRIDKLSAKVQALEEVDGRISTSRSSSSEGEIWNWKWQNRSWWFRAGPRVNSRQRRSIARMVQRVEMSGWQDRREMKMCFPWVPYRLGRKRSTGRRKIFKFRARQEAVMMRSNTRYVSQDGLDTKGLDTRGLFT